MYGVNYAKLNISINKMEYGPITYINYVNNQLPKQYAFCDLTEELQKLAKIVNPECESPNWKENEKLIKRDEKGMIIIEDPRDAQIKALTDHLTQLTNQLNVLTQVVNPTRTVS